MTPALDRVLLVNYEFPPLGGGAGIATRQLALALGRTGVRVDIVTAAPDRAPEPSYQQREGPGGVVVHRVAPGVVAYRLRIPRPGIHEASMASVARFVLRSSGLLRQLVRSRSYDVAHLFFSLPTGALLPLLRSAEVPTMVSLRGSDVPGYDPWNKKLRVAHSVLKPLTRWIWRNADLVAAVTSSLVEQARQTDSRLSAVVLGNGVDLDRFHPPAAPARRAGPIRCLTVSRLIERKGIDDILRAMRILPEDRFELTIVGTGSEEDKLRALATSLGLDDRVRFVGGAEHDRLARFYREADLFVLTPLAEAFGNVFAEALASGLPIVASGIGGALDLVTPGRNGVLTAPRDPESLARAIDSLAADAGARTRMARQNREDAVARLSWDHVAQSYLTAYSRIAVSDRVGEGVAV